MTKVTVQEEPIVVVEKPVAVQPVVVVEKEKIIEVEKKPSPVIVTTTTEE